MTNERGERLTVGMNPTHKPADDPVVAASDAQQARRALGERTVVERRGGPRGLTLLLLDNGREYDAETGLQHNSGETVITT